MPTIGFDAMFADLEAMDVQHQAEEEKAAQAMLEHIKEMGEGLGMGDDGVGKKMMKPQGHGGAGGSGMTPDSLLGLMGEMKKQLPHPQVREITSKLPANGSDADGLAREDADHAAASNAGVDDSKDNTDNVSGGNSLELRDDMSFAEMMAVVNCREQRHSEQRSKVFENVLSSLGGCAGDIPLPPNFESLLAKTRTVVATKPGTSKTNRKKGKKARK